MRLVRWWLNLYTAGLPSEVKCERLAEIEYDVWEHERNGEAEGQRSDVIQGEIFFRFLTGIPADLLWRREQAGAERRSKEGNMVLKQSGNATTSMGFILAGVLLAAIYMIGGVSVSLGWANNGDIPRFWWAFIGLLPGAMILVGLWASMRSPLLGGILITVGAVPLAIMFYWTIILPLLAMTVVIFGVVRAIEFARERRTPS